MAKESFKKDRLLCFTRSPGQLHCRWLRGLLSVATDESCHVLWLVGRPFISIFPRGLAPVIAGSAFRFEAARDNSRIVGISSGNQALASNPTDEPITSRLPVIRSQSAASSKWSFQLPKGGQ